MRAFLDRRDEAAAEHGKERRESKEHTRGGRQRYGESRTWLTRLLSLPVVQRPSIGRARALRASAVLMAGAGDVAAGDALMEERVALCRQLGDPTELACALLGLGSIRALWLRADTSEATARRAYLHEAAALFRQLGEADELSAVLIALGRLDLHVSATDDPLAIGLVLALGRRLLLGEFER